MPRNGWVNLPRNRWVSLLRNQWVSLRVFSTAGHIKLAPNNKIYFSSAYHIGALTYPYSDTTYNSFNMNLGVINRPDSSGLMCDFLPYSFYLGGKRTYWGLPNNPNYDLGPLVGSPCDSLTSIADQLSVSTADLYIYYSSYWQSAFINADNLQGYSYQLQIIDLMGKRVFTESGRLNPPYYTKTLNCAGYSNGMYIVELQTEKERLVKRFVVQ